MGRGGKWGEREDEGGRWEGPGNPEAGAGQIGQEMRDGQRELELQDAAVTSVSSGQRKGLCGAREGSGNLRKQWTSVRRARGERPYPAPARRRTGASAGRTWARDCGLGPAGRRACGQRDGPPAAPRGPAGLGLPLTQRRFSAPIGCCCSRRAGHRCPEKNVTA